MAVVPLPPPVEIDNETKRAVIDGLKRVLLLFQQRGVVDSTLTYHELISEPYNLTGFIQAFLDNRALADDIVRSREGRVVRDDDQVLVCGVSINQIQHLLVRTCAKKVLEQTIPTEVVTETVTRKKFLFFRSTEQVEVERPTNDPVEARKIRELLRYIAFGWQLPLLDAYREHLNYHQISEIGEDLVALRGAADIAAIGAFEASTLRKVKQMTGADFADILADRPEAIGGIAVWNRDMYEFYHKMLGERAWAFFAREPAFFNVVAALDKATARVYGDVLCYIASENLEEIQRLNIDKSEVLVTSLRSAFGDNLPLVLSHPGLAKEILRKIVDNLLHMSQDKDKLLMSFMLTCKAMVPSVLEWVGRQNARS
jgi:hypothetical protein